VVGAVTLKLEQFSDDVYETEKYGIRNKVKRSE
jgi:hypothetical protein